MTPELQRYLDDARSRGMNDAQIAAELKGAGWTDEQARNALVPSTQPSQPLAAAAPIGTRTMRTGTIIIAALALCIVGGGAYGAYYWYSNSSARSDQNDTRPSVMEQVNTNVVVEKKDDASEAFRSERYGFELMIGKGWTTQHFSDRVSGIWFTSPETTRSFDEENAECIRKLEETSRSMTEAERAFWDPMPCPGSFGGPADFAFFNDPPQDIDQSSVRNVRVNGIEYRRYMRSGLDSIVYETTQNGIVYTFSFMDDDLPAEEILATAKYFSPDPTSILDGKWSKIPYTVTTPRETITFTYMHHFERIDESDDRISLIDTPSLVALRGDRARRHVSLLRTQELSFGGVFFPDTNFVDASIVVSSFDSTTESECLDDLRSPEVTAAWTKKKLGSIDYSYAATSGAAAGTYLEQRHYRTAQCTEFLLSIKTSSIANFGPDTSIKQVNTDRIWKAMEDMVATAAIQ